MDTNRRERQPSTAVIRAEASDAQAAALHDLLMKARLRVGYQEEQHGPTLVVTVRCQHLEERAVRDMLEQIGLVPIRNEEEL